MYKSGSFEAITYMPIESYKTLWLQFTANVFKLCQSRPLFVYIRLCYTVESRKLTIKIDCDCIRTRTSGVENECSTHWATTTPRYNWCFVSPGMELLQYIKWNIFEYVQESNPQHHHRSPSNCAQLLLNYLRQS